MWGFLQALLGKAAIAPSGDPDKVGASQYLESVRKLTRKHVALYTVGPDTIGLNEFAMLTGSQRSTDSEWITLDEALAPVAWGAPGVHVLPPTGQLEAGQPCGFEAYAETPDAQGAPAWQLEVLRSMEFPAGMKVIPRTYAELRAALATAGDTRACEAAS